jgi:hypothetical protein
MSDEETQSVEEEVPQEASAQATESEQVAERQETAEERRKRNDQEYNWAEARRKMQELDRQNRDMAEQLQKMQQSKNPEVDEEAELAKLGDEELVSVSQVKKLAASMAKKVANQVMKEREASTVDERLQSKYSDYADVVSKENIELLKQQEPELALSLWRLADDPYAQGVAAYKLLKKVGVNSDMPSPEKEKALKNSKKPLSVNAVTKQSAIGNAHIFENGLTPELKKSLLKEMQEAAKRA